jgi:hypothetical protein
MNLHGIVRGAIGIVNPHTPATLHRSNGYTTQEDGTQVPTYAAVRTLRVQVQAMSYGDLQQVAGLNLQGEARAIYIDGAWDGVVRPDRKGGDLIVIGATRWLVIQSLESWPDWTKVAAVRQL